MSVAQFDLVVLGGGPAGHAAATVAARAGRTALLVEQEAGLGGACVQKGTIPSKTLRETALALGNFRRRTGGVYQMEVREDVQVESLMTRLQEVVTVHARAMADDLQRSGVETWHGRARFVDAQCVEVLALDGGVRLVRGGAVVVATGSRPRVPPGIPLDHASILDSDSVLSMTWLPSSLTVLGAGVIACEYASIFAALGTKVTLVDRGDRPLGFLDQEITACFEQDFREAGGTLRMASVVESVTLDGLGRVVTQLKDGTSWTSDRMFCAQGRVAQVEGLALAAAGLATTASGVIAVNAHCQTAVKHIYAVGDVIGPPSLASTGADQGRRAAQHALGLEALGGTTLVPMAVYAIPELASVGLTEKQARELGPVWVGRAPLHELARGRIAAMRHGLLKLVASQDGAILGVHVVGEGASEIIHVGQLAIAAGMKVNQLQEMTFNFPTLCEAYRVAALRLEAA